jgi:hypothetical protein
MLRPPSEESMVIRSKAVKNQKTLLEQLFCNMIGMRSTRGCGTKIVLGPPDTSTVARRPPLSPSDI